MKVSKLLALLLLLGIVSCSNKSAKNDVDKESEKIIVEESEEDADFVVDSDEELILGADEHEALVTKDSNEKSSLNSDEMMIETQPLLENEGASKMGEYVVQKGDTLMLIAFKLFGDYGKWKDILGQNPGLSAVKLSEGKVLKYKMMGELFEWNPKGNPYLIKRGDTLGSISTDKYGTDKKWQLIYDNNRPLIKDPNLIFAGFTLYYIPKRDIASEQ